MVRALGPCWLLLWLLACSPPVPAGGESSDGGATAGGTGSTTGAPPLATTTGTGTTGSTSMGDVSESGIGGTTSSPDLPHPDETSCDPYTLMSCPEGQKCVWLDGGDLSNADVACVPEPRQPIPAGAHCPEDPDYTGLDECEAGSVCLPFGDLAGIWTCTPLCQGDPEHPYCGPLQVCVTTRTWAFCEALCSPLVQDCPDDEVCVVNGVATMCIQPLPDDFDGAVGSPCEYPDDCAPATICVPAEELPDCAGDACCAPLCSVYSKSTEGSRREKNVVSVDSLLG